MLFNNKKTGARLPSIIMGLVFIVVIIIIIVISRN